MSRNQELFKRVKELGQKSIAVTDHGFMSSIYDAYKEYKNTGIKFIPGIESYILNNYGIINEGEKGRKKSET